MPWIGVRRCWSPRPRAAARPWWPSSRSTARWRSGGKTFYTTPLKALSNQKFGDLVAKHGPERVGLLTGDNTINSEAPVVVMTTEVLRNMLYERSDTLTGLVSVVMDEVHYLQDPYRGAVWEEVLIHLPLSASAWCACPPRSATRRSSGSGSGRCAGETRVVIEEKRPVPAGAPLPGGAPAASDARRAGRRAAAEPLRRLARPARAPHQDLLPTGERSAASTSGSRAPREGNRRVYVPRREEVVEVLAEQGMLPAIYFVFSRAGCDKSVRWLRESGVRSRPGPRPNRSASVRRCARRGWTTATSPRLGF